MNPKAKTLAMRDAAAAALMGAIGEGDADFGIDFGGDYGEDDSYGVDFGADMAIAAPQAAPPPHALLALWQKHQADSSNTRRRAMLLEPNKGSKVKVERYTFYLNQSLVLGTASAIAASGNPDCDIRPQRVTVNAPTYGFCTLTNIKVANVSVLIGGIADAFDFNANGVGQSLDLPTLTPANRASIDGSYTGFVPPGFAGGSAYTFCAGLKGPASMVA